MLIWLFFRSRCYMMSVLHSVFLCCSLHPTHSFLETLYCLTSRIFCVLCFFCLLPPPSPQHVPGTLSSFFFFFTRSELFYFTNSLKQLQACYSFGPVYHFKPSPHPHFKGRKFPLLFLPHLRFVDPDKTFDQPFRQKFV